MLRELMKSASRPWEIAALLKLKMASRSAKSITPTPEFNDESISRMTDREFCYAALNKVSRSFAVVIQQLPVELRDPVCIFYLVLRGLDSIEDDATFPSVQKIPLLKSFHEKNNLSGWNIRGVGDTPDYRTLLAHYDKVARAYQQLDDNSQSIISRICEQMGAGMAEFVDRRLWSLQDYELYCYYVAGLVGVGLSELFAVSEVETKALRSQPNLSISMGLFLQKTNIVRDYHEDLHADRQFWPEEVWRSYTDNLGSFEGDPYAHDARACLNELVTDVMQHATDSLAYLSQLENRQVFRFCAIPQAMAMATMTKVYNNPNVFTSTVKIRKGLTAMMLKELSDYRTVRRYFNYFAKSLTAKIDPSDPSAGLLHDHLRAVIEECKEKRVYAA